MHQDIYIILIIWLYKQTVIQSSSCIYIYVEWGQRGGDFGFIAQIISFFLNCKCPQETPEREFTEQRKYYMFESNCRL